MFKYIGRYARKPPSRASNLKMRQHKGLLATQNMDEILATTEPQHRSPTLKVGRRRLSTHIKQIEQRGRRLEINISEIMKYQRKINQLENDISELKETTYGLMAMAQIITSIVIFMTTLTVGNMFIL